MGKIWFSLFFNPESNSSIALFLKQILIISSVKNIQHLQHSKSQNIVLTIQKIEFYTP